MERQWKGVAADFIKAMKLKFVGQGANPNDILVQDLYNYQSPSVQSGGAFKNLSKANALDEFKAMTVEERNIFSSLLAVYNEHINTKREVLLQARNLFESDIVQTVIDVMIDDGFNSFNNEKEEFKIEYILEQEDLDNLGEEYQEQVQNVIDEFVDKFSIKTKVADIVPDILRDGEYAFGVLFDENNKKGVTEIVDDFDVINLLPFYDGDKLAFVINQNHFSDNKTTTINIANWSRSMDEKPVVYKPDNIVFFRLKGPTKLRINMGCFYDTEFKKTFKEKTGINLPKYIRTALPIYYSAMRTLNRIKIMENVSTVLDLNDVLKPEIVHVSVPTNTTSEEASQIIRDYERHLNENNSFDGDNLDVASLAAQANRRKVLPTWYDTKGTLSSAAINQAAKGQGAWDSIDRLRNLAALSIGIPPFYINIAGTPIEKAQIIKLYSRYTRKLTSLQKTLADGIKDLLMIHLEHCGFNIQKSNLSVKFKAITSGDSLDDTDMLVGLVAGIGDLYKALDEITSSENNKLVLDDEQFKELFDDLTNRYLNISSLLRIDDNKFENIDGQDGAGFEPIGSPGDHSREPAKAPDNGAPFNPEAGNEGEEAYNDFVADSNDIGVPGTEPAIEEI